MRQWVYGTQYLDEPVCMYKGGYRLYYHQDANYNVLALTDDRGNEVERYQYTPYGRVAVETFSDWADSDGDGDVDLTDFGVFSAAFNGPNRVPLGSPPDYRWDADFDGDVDMTDYNTFSALFNGLNGVVRRSAGRTASVVGNPLLHQGLYQDAETGLYHNRARTYHPTLGRFMQRDPVGMWPNDRGRADVLKQYTDGVNGYQYVRSRPSSLRDSAGTYIISILECLVPCGKCAMGLYDAAQKRDSCDSQKKACEDDLRCSNTSLADEAFGLSDCLAQWRECIKGAVQAVDNAMLDCMDCIYCYIPTPRLPAPPPRPPGKPMPYVPPWGWPSALPRDLGCCTK